MPLRTLRRAFAQSILFCAATSSLRAQTTGGVVHGLVTRAESTVAIPFALIKLLPVGTGQGGMPVKERITDAAGRFRFVDVPPGDYTLQLLRIGYRPVVSSPLSVVEGQTVRQDMHVESQPVVLATVNVHANPVCLTAAQLPNEARLFALWTEARRSVETRRAFERQFRFTRILRQDVELEWRLRKNSRRVKVDTTINEPDSVLARDKRLQVAGREKGYGEGMTLIVPNEKELLDDSFLAQHCLDTEVLQANGAFGLRFHPVQNRDSGFDIGGTIWIEENTYALRTLELEHFRDDRRVGQSRIDYAEITIDGSSLRLPVAGVASIRASGPNRTLVSGATAQLAYSYRDFTSVR